MELRYPLKSLYGDYLRALIGMVILGTPFFYSLINGSFVVTTIMGMLLSLFLIFGIRTYFRQITIISVGDDGIASSGPFGRRLAWNDLVQVDLRYYSTRREKAGKGDGWMQMKICDSGRCMKFDSSLQHFNDLAAKVAATAFQNNAEMSETTIENFTAMGITIAIPEEAVE